MKCYSMLAIGIVLGIFISNLYSTYNTDEVLTTSIAHQEALAICRSSNLPNDSSVIIYRNKIFIYCVNQNNISTSDSARLIELMHFLNFKGDNVTVTFHNYNIDDIGVKVM